MKPPEGTNTTPAAGITGCTVMIAPEATAANKSAPKARLAMIQASIFPGILPGAPLQVQNGDDETREGDRMYPFP